uniref:Immunoglobulin V-set domain-containing protein n=1 Tax=Mastacembelus armatus TaxID=205130 RepID=A0A3Q3KJ02_9TELE
MLLLLKLQSVEAARILCPNEPIEAEIGEDVRLPCLLDPGLDLSDLTVDWTRVNDSKVVFSYRSRMINDIDQLEQYRNRTRLSREDLSVGNMELQMFSAQLSDSGRYRKWTDQSQHPVICVTLRGQRSLFTLPLYVSVFKHHLPIQGLQIVRKRAQRISLDTTHLSHHLFQLLPSGRSFRAPNIKTARHKGGFFPQAVQLLNS